MHPDIQFDGAESPLDTHLPITPSLNILLKKSPIPIAELKKLPTFAPVIETTTVTRHRKGAIAQLVEQRTENPCVPGSIPGGTTLLESCNDVTLFFYAPNLG